MKAKGLIKIVSLFIGVLLCVAVLNLPVSTKQGINYRVSTIKIPLYIKIIEFLDRNYHYKELTKRICNGYSNDQDKVLALFEWTHQNIKRDIPEGWPIIDDHVWHIIVRGYGARDQFSDVFTTLCNYTDIDAFYSWVYTKEGSRIPLSFVKLDKRWCLFDPYNGIYFKNKDGGFASLDDITKGNWVTNAVSEFNESKFNYSVYFTNLPSTIEEGFSRSNIQSPLNRLSYEVNKIIKRK